MPGEMKEQESSNESSIPFDPPAVSFTEVPEIHHLGRGEQKIVF